jgi:hypothetical protein
MPFFGCQKTTLQVLLTTSMLSSCEGVGPRSSERHIRTILKNSDSSSLTRMDENKQNQSRAELLKKFCLVSSICQYTVVLLVLFSLQVRTFSCSLAARSRARRSLLSVYVLLVG